MPPRRTALNRAIEEFVAENRRYGGAIRLDAVSRTIYFKYGKYTVSTSFLPNTEKRTIRSWLNRCKSDHEKLEKAAEERERRELQGGLPF